MTWAAAAVGVALAAAGCGGSGSSAPAQSAAAARYTRELAASARRPVRQVPEKPIPVSAFRAPIAAYRVYAEGQLAHMQRANAQLAAALAAGDRPGAEAAWRAAFATYLRLGAVYGAFGPLDAAIDGLPGGLPGGTKDPHFTGLHRIEQGLWTGEPLAHLRPVAARLRADVTRLRRAVPTLAVAPVDYATRAHEILEDAQRDYLSGADVPWSGEGVLATQSALAATDEVVDTLSPILDGDIATETRTGLVRLRADLAQVRADHDGRLPTDAALGQHDRELLASGMGGALEALQDIPGSLETTVPPPTPTLPAQ